MRKKKQTTSKAISIRATKGKRGKTTMPSEKPVGDGWEHLLKIREKLGRPGKAAESSEKSSDEVIKHLAEIGEELSKGWQSEKSAVEILSDMRR
jgi:hypothetical protein